MTAVPEPDAKPRHADATHRSVSVRRRGYLEAMFGYAQQTRLKTRTRQCPDMRRGPAYQNYVDPTLTDWRRAYYGPAADRLTGVKKQYDPDRLFDFPQAL
jgi:hypothetical protein